MLVRRLPRESSTARELHPENAWSQTDYLLANVIDALAAGNWQRGGDRTARKPRPIPRPRSVSTPRESPAEIKARIDAWDERRRKSAKTG